MISILSNYVGESFEDLFKHIVLNSITFLELAVAIVVALIVGLYIFMVYKVSFRSTVYSYTFNMSLVALVLITTLIILTVSSNNLIVTLGMLGTLGVIRFRTSLKDPIDIVYVLWATSAGFAIGATQYLIATMGTLSLGIIFISLSRFRVRLKSYVIVVNYPKEIDKQIVFATRNKHVKVKSKYIEKHNVELTLEVTKNYQKVMDELNNIELIDNISLLTFED